MAKAKLGFLEWAGHGESRAQRSNRTEIEKRVKAGESASSIYKSLKSEGRGMRKQDVLESAAYARERQQPAQEMRPRTYHPEAIRRTPRVTKTGKAKQYRPTARGVWTAKGETRKPHEYIVQVGSRKGKDGKSEKVFVTVTSDRPLTETQVKRQADKMNLATYGIKRRHFKIVGVRVK